MSEHIIISQDKLKDILAEAFDEGWASYQELKEEVVERLLEKCEKLKVEVAEYSSSPILVNQEPLPPETIRLRNDDGSVQHNHPRDDANSMRQAGGVTVTDLRNDDHGSGYAGYPRDDANSIIQQATGVTDLQQEVGHVLNSVARELYQPATVTTNVINDEAIRWDFHTASNAPSIVRVPRDLPVIPTVIPSIQ